MTAPIGYLDAALRRMRLPIRVKAWRSHDNAAFLQIGKITPGGGHVAVTGYGHAEATAAYLTLCRELDPTAS